MKPWTKRARERLRAARKKAWADPAVRQRMSAAIKKAWADPAVRQRMSAARKKACADPAVRQRMSAARKKAWADLSGFPASLRDSILLLRRVKNVITRRTKKEALGGQEQITGCA